MNYQIEPIARRLSKNEKSNPLSGCFDYMEPDKASHKLLDFWQAKRTKKMERLFRRR